MFQILSKSNIDFMGKRNVLLTISLVLVIAAAVIVWTNGLNLGIEFKGGTELRIKFADQPDPGRIRAALADAGLDNYNVTHLGNVEEHEIYVQVGLTTEGEEEKDDVTAQVLAALTPEEVADQQAAGLVDLNVVDAASLRSLLEIVSGLPEAEAAALAEAVSERRKEVAIFRSLDDLAEVPGMTPEILERLEGRTFLGPFAQRSQSYIGPAIGREIMQKALWAILGSLAGMLIYIWIRFQFQWGLAAVVALAHDSVITLGLFSLFNKEMSLPVVAAFLTLIGYSVNDTVVVFDRIRENLRLRGSTQDLPSLVNMSINQTLSRTIITSGLTWIVVMGLFLFGGEALNSFAFVLVVGTLVGTYSSIYIASPILVLWSSMTGKRTMVRAASKSRPTRTARRVPGR